MPTATLRRPKRAPAAAAPDRPPPLSPDSLHRFTLAEYQRMIDIGVLGEKDRCHLLNGVIRKKMPENTPHLSTRIKLGRRLARVISDDLLVLTDAPIQFPNSESEPEPDFFVTAGPDTRFDRVKPVAADVLLVIEVSDTSLASDRGEMLGIYAGGKIAEYWIVNLVDNIVEVYTKPRGGRTPTYRARTDYAVGESVPVVLGGAQLGSIAVADILPGGN